jgi:DNA-binding CsgD family transcriptional regulator
LAAVFITDPERETQTDPELFRHLYGLTPAEARFAVRLLSGEGVEEAADRLQITINTARTHVRHVLEKTGTHRISDLVRVLLGSFADVRIRRS